MRRTGKPRFSRFQRGSLTFYVTTLFLYSIRLAISHNGAGSGHEPKYRQIHGANEPLS